MFVWDHSRIDLAEWDLDEELFKKQMDRLDLLHELEAAVVRYDDRMQLVRIEAARMDLHPDEVPYVDGVGTMEELSFHKSLAIKSINYIRNSLPVLLNTD